MQPECIRSIQAEHQIRNRIRQENHENSVHLNITTNNLSMDTCMHTQLILIIIKKDFVDQTSIIVVGRNYGNYWELERYGNSNVHGFNLRCY